MKIEVIGNEDACSLGDAMRHIYEAGLVRGNFILTIGPVVGNVNLAKVLEEHKARAKDDKELTMTMVRLCSAWCSPVPNLRLGPNYRPDGDQWSKLIRDQDLFTDYMGLYQNF